MAKVTVTQGTTEAGKYRGYSATAQAVGVTVAAEAGTQSWCARSRSNRAVTRARNTELLV